MNAVFGFGEKLDVYEIPVLNEREVRASAGIVFLFALLAFMNAWLVGDFRFARIFVVAFLIDFTIRIFVNPKYAPSLILARFAVRKQAAEYVRAGNTAAAAAAPDRAATSNCSPPDWPVAMGDSSRGA